MRVHVAESKCQGHTLCAMNAPQVFELSEDDGHAYAPNEHAAPADEQAVLAAVQSCPEQAIEIIGE